MFNRCQLVSCLRLLRVRASVRCCLSLTIRRFSGRPVTYEQAPLKLDGIGQVSQDLLVLVGHFYYH